MRVFGRGAAGTVLQRGLDLAQVLELGLEDGDLLAEVPAREARGHLFPCGVPIAVSLG